MRAKERGASASEIERENQRTQSYLFAAIATRNLTPGLSMLVFLNLNKLDLDHHQLSTPRPILESETFQSNLAKVE